MTMKKYKTVIFGLMFFITAIANAVLSKDDQKGAKMNSIYDFTMKDIDGKDIKLEQFKGKVILIVNVASKCGFTPQYEGLQKIYSQYKDQGFLILGFPANNFLNQEPGTDEQIKQFCSLNYDVTFPMFSKISVKGKDIAPLYKFLTEKETNPEFSGNISWNFNKFLIDREGKNVARFGSRSKPDSEAVIQAITYDRENTYQELNEILHEFSSIIIGRLGLPYRERNLSIISLIVDGNTDEIGAMTGKIGQLSGITIRMGFAKF